MKDFFDNVITKGGFLYLVNEFQKSNYIKDDFDSFYMQEKIEDKEEFLTPLKLTMFMIIAQLLMELTTL